MSEASSHPMAADGERSSMPEPLERCSMKELKERMASLQQAIQFQEAWAVHTLVSNTASCIAEFTPIIKIVESILDVLKDDPSFADLQDSYERCTAVIRLLARGVYNELTVYSEMERYFDRMMEIVKKKHDEMSELLRRKVRWDDVAYCARQCFILQAFKQMHWHHNRQKDLRLETQSFARSLAEESEKISALQWAIFDKSYDPGSFSQTHMEVREDEDDKACPICTEDYETESSSQRLRVTMACCAHKNSLCAGCLNLHVFQADLGADSTFSCPFCRHEIPLYGVEAQVGACQRRPNLPLASIIE